MDENDVGCDYLLPWDRNARGARDDSYHGQDKCMSYASVDHEGDDTIMLIRTDSAL